METVYSALIEIVFCSWEGRREVGMMCSEVGVVLSSAWLMGLKPPGKSSRRDSRPTSSSLAQGSRLGVFAAIWMGFGARDILHVKVNEGTGGEILSPTSCDESE